MVPPSLLLDPFNLNEIRLGRSSPLDRSICLDVFVMSTVTIRGCNAGFTVQRRYLNEVVDDQPVAERNRWW
jgi:hypothetical protein